MKKAIIYILLITYVLTFLSGCSNSKSNKATENKDIIGESFLNEQENTNLGAFSFGIVSNNYDKQVYDYNGKEIKIPFKVSGMDEKLKSEFGLMVFVDGIAQPYKIVNKQKSSIEQVLHRFALKDNESKQFDIVFSPLCGKKGDRVGIVFATILKPDYMPESGKQTYGIYHSLNSNVAQEIYFRKGVKKRLKGYSNFSVENRILTKNNSLGISVKEDDTVDNSLVTELSAEKKDMDIYHAKNGKIKFDFLIYGGQEANYRTVFFINHKPIRIMNSDYIETSTKKGKMCRVKIELDINKFSKFNTLYAISNPYGKDYMSVSDFPKKTRSFLIINDK